MPGSKFLTLLDDIAMVLDDVALMSKKALGKTAGVLGDDLALNAEQVSGVDADRELPVVWAVAKGAMLNKLILVPAALAINLFLPKLMMPLLMLGGAYLCFEGAEKLLHKLFPSSADRAEQQAHLAAVANEAVDLVAFEKGKIRGAIRTDFILSAEILVIALSTVASQPLSMQAMVLSTVAFLMTIGVYGLVAGIIKLDDWGLAWSTAANRLKASIGRALLSAAPKLMRFLSIAGTAAMFLVGGQIIVHGIPVLHHALERLQVEAAGLGGLGKLLSAMGFEAVIGLLTGALCVALVKLAKSLRK